MSMQAINYAMTLPVDDSGPRLLLIIIAHHVHWKTGTMHVSQEELAAEARMSTRTCRRHLSTLEESGFILRTERRDEKGHRLTDEIELIGYLEWQDVIYNGGVIPDPSTRGKRVSEQPDKISGGDKAYRTKLSSLPDKSCKPTGHCCPVDIEAEPLREPLLVDDHDPTDGRDTRKSSSVKVRKKATPLPPDWQPDLAWAKARFSASDAALHMEAEKFRSYHESKGSLMKDWQRAWQYWLLNGISKLPRRTDQSSTSGKSSGFTLDPETKARLDREYEEAFQRARKAAMEGTYAHGE